MLQFFFCVRVQCNLKVSLKIFKEAGYGHLVLRTFFYGILSSNYMRVRQTSSCTRREVFYHDHSKTLQHQQQFIWDKLVTLTRVSASNRYQTRVGMSIFSKIMDFYKASYKHRKMERNVSRVYKLLSR